MLTYYVHSLCKLDELQLVFDLINRNHKKIRRVHISEILTYLLETKKEYKLMMKLYHKWLHKLTPPPYSEYSNVYDVTNCSTPCFFFFATFLNVVFF